MSWPQTRFGDLYMIPSRNGLMRPSRVRGEGIKMVNMGELFANQLIGDIPMERVPMNERELANSSLAEGDLLFARQSLVLEGAGQCSYIASLPEPTTFESHLIRVRLDQTKAIPLFYHYYFRSPYSGMSTIVQQCAQAGIRASELTELKVGYPPIEVQKAVVDLLAPYDDLIENNRRRMALLEESARLLYREWFVRLRFPGYEHTRIVGGVPQGWDRVRVDELGAVLTGKTPATKDADYYGGDIPFVKTPDMHGNAFVLQSETYLTEKGAKSQANKFLPPGALLVSCIGTVGVVSLTSELCQFNQQINAVIPAEDFLRYYCYFALKDMKPRLDAIGGGVTMANVSKGKFESMDLLRPTAALLRNFDEFSSPVFNQIKVLGQQNQKLRTARDLLLPRLMSGELAV